MRSHFKETASLIKIEILSIAIVKEELSNGGAVMKNVNIVIGSAVMAVLVVGAHSFIQFVFTKSMPDVFEIKKILLFLIVFIGCIGLSKREARGE